MTSADDQARLAKLYDDEILPAYAARFAALILRKIEPRPAARVVEIGCATGHVTRELARRYDPDSHIIALDEAPAFLAAARAKLEADTMAHAPVELVAGPRLPAELPLATGSADLVISNLAIAAAADPGAAVVEAARLLDRNGRLIVSAPLRGSWAEFLDLIRDVLRESGKRERLASFERYIDGLPDGDELGAWLERAGLGGVELSVQRWEILFKSAREFFFAPLVEHGPLPRWKQLAGRGGEMQDVFFFTKEAIDTYFKGRAFPITIVGASATGVR